MREGWRGGRDEGTPCGTGCLRAHTQNIRTRLPGLLRRHDIFSICDAGAGDLYWARETFRGFDYRAFDLVPRSAEVTRLDITKEVLPQCDVILCRAVLIHLDPPRVQRALDLFRQSARFLLASQYDNAGAFNPGLQFNPTDLTHALGAPIERIPDLEGNKSDLALWSLQ